MKLGCTVRTVKTQIAESQTINIALHHPSKEDWALGRMRPSINLTISWSTLPRPSNHNWSWLQSGSNQVGIWKNNNSLLIFRNFWTISNLLGFVWHHCLLKNWEEKERKEYSCLLILQLKEEIKKGGEVREISLPHPRCRFTEKHVPDQDPALQTPTWEMPSTHLNSFQAEKSEHFCSWGGKTMGFYFSATLSRVLWIWGRENPKTFTFT